MSKRFCSLCNCEIAMILNMFKLQIIQESDNNDVEFLIGDLGIVRQKAFI